MKSDYDDYDYPAYWHGRDYEHLSEVIALNHLLKKIPNNINLADIGCGYGRLAPCYLKKSKKAFLVEPSKSLLKIGKDRLKSKKLMFINSDIDKATQKIKPHSLDAVVMVRVMHHLKDSEKTLKAIDSLLTQKGYLILEFANKLHGKALFKNLIKGDLMYPLDIEPENKLSEKNKDTECLPFLNYHPDKLKQVLKEHNYKLLDSRSVSNVRIPIIKKLLPLNLLLSIERALQKPCASLNFGPSIFMLLQKQTAATV